MKNNVLITIVILIAISLNSCDKKAGGKATLNTLNDSASYCLGTSYAMYMKQTGDDKYIDPDIFIAGFLHGFDTTKLQIPVDQIQKIRSKYVAIVTKEREEELKHQAEENLDEAKQFLELNLTKDGIMKTESGLQYEIIEKGDGPKPKATDKVKVHYHGTLLNGKVFDSSTDRGEPVEFFVNRVIKGWQEALPLMSVGAKWKLFIPPDLAYGNRKVGNVIEPNSALIFEVELLEIVNVEENKK